MKKVGFIGWRGMVGSVLMERILIEKDFSQEEFSQISLFTTSQKRQTISLFPRTTHTLQDAYDLNCLSECDILVSCQGGDYTKNIHPRLRSQGWKGYWIDAASSLRMAEESIMILDPVNHDIIDKGLNRGIKDFIGSNCTVSVLIMAIAGLFKAEVIEWISNMTYQAASGAGSQSILEMIKQMGIIGELEKEVNGKDILHLEKEITHIMNSSQFPKKIWKQPLAGNILPWVDSEVEGGQSREEYKGMVEAHKILGGKRIPIDGTCVRVPVLRCHSKALTIKLKKSLSLEKIEGLIRSAHPWIKWVPNDKESTLKELTPAAVTGSLNIAVGRVRKLNFSGEYLNVFCIGDQLLWGAAEPLRRMLMILLEKKL